MDEECLDCVACCWIAAFRVQEDFDGDFLVGVGVEVDGAEAVCVAEDRDLGVVFYIAD